MSHGGPENLKKSRPGKNTRGGKQMNQFFSRAIAFLAVLNFFPVQKFIFGHFWNYKKWIFGKNLFSWNWFIWFHDFFLAWTFLIFRAHCASDIWYPNRKHKIIYSFSQRAKIRVGIKMQFWKAYVYIKS